VFGAAALIVVGAAVALSLLIGQGRTIRGIATLYDTNFENPAVTGDWDDCSGTGGYSDFSAGMALRLRDGSGDIIGTGHVENVTQARLADLAEMDRIAEAQGFGFFSLDSDSEEEAVIEIREALEELAGFVCVLYFEGEVDDSDFYSVELGSRGDLTYSAEEMARNEYVVYVSLGD
jgi:hypothetical protein